MRWRRGADAAARRTSAIRHSGQGQEEIVAAVLGGRDVLAVMPTGSGKSLGLSAAGGDAARHDARRVAADLADEGSGRRAESPRHPVGRAAFDAVGRRPARRARAPRAPDALRLLYVAPERFASDPFLRLLGELADRPLRRSTKRTASRSGATISVPTTGACARRRGAVPAAAIARRGRPPIAAFTATATPEVRDDIVALLGLERAAGARRRIRSAEHLPARRARRRTRTRRTSCCRGSVRGRRALVYAATRKSAEAAAASCKPPACRRRRITPA